MSTVDVAIALLAEMQFGVFSRLQVLKAGGYDQLIARRIGSGAWIEVRPGVYRLPGFGESYGQRKWAAHLALEDEAVLSHEAAAKSDGIYGFPMEAVTFTVPHGAHPRLSGVRIHQISDLFTFPHHIREKDGLRVTTTARTFVDLAGERQWSTVRLRDAFNDAWIKRLVSLEEQYQVLTDLDRPRKPGVKRMLAILARYNPDECPPDSLIEQVFIEACDTYGIGRPLLHADHPGRDLPNSCCDGLFLPELVIGEVDGRDAHARERDRARDAYRDRQAARAGHLTLRWTYDSIAHDPGGSMAELAETLDIRGKQLGLKPRTQHTEPGT